jgi:hypothetical protein
MAHQTGNLPKKEEIQQHLPTTAIQHYRLLQQQRRATPTTTTTLTHLQKTDMITTMSRGNQEDRVGSVLGRQEDQEEDVAEVEEVEVEEEEDEDEMKMEKLEGTENIGTESTENVSSGAFDGEISEVSPSQKRTSACLNIAQDIAQEMIALDSGNKASTQNVAQAVSIGVAKGVNNDSKQAQTQHLTARGLIKTMRTRATNIYTSIYRATVIPNTTSIDTNASTDTNAKLNIINKNINGVDNVTEKEENSISISLSVNSIDSTIKIYEAGGVDNIDLVNNSNEENSISGSLLVKSTDSTIKIYEAGGVDSITLGENNNKLVNNSTGCNNINDNNNNTSVLNEENTPGEVNSENKLELVDSYPLNRNSLSLRDSHRFKKEKNETTRTFAVKTKVYLFRYNSVRLKRQLLDEMNPNSILSMESNCRPLFGSFELKLLKK